MPRKQIHDMDIGGTGLRQTGGFIDERFHQHLRGSRAISVYEEMRDNDAMVGACLFAFSALIRSVSWRILPAEEDNPKAQENVDFLRECQNDMEHSWEEMISNILSMIVFGFSYHEVVYKRRLGTSSNKKKNSRYNDGRVGWRKIPIRGQNTLDRWEYDDSNDLKGMWQNTTYEKNKPSSVLIPLHKALLFRTSSYKDNPEGRSMLRNAYRSWYFAKRLQELEAIGAERDLAGMPVMQVPPRILSKTATNDEKALRRTLEDLVSQVRKDEHAGLVVPNEVDEQGRPTGYKFGLLTSGGRRSIDTDRIIKRYESRILMSMLAEVIMLGSDKTGSYALASSKTHLFSVGISSLLRSIQDTFNNYAIPRLFALNPDLDQTLLPTFEHGDVETPALSDLAVFIRDLVNAGALTPDKGMERKLRTFANLPELPEGLEDELEEMQQMPDTQEPGGLQPEGEEVPPVQEREEPEA